MFQPSELPSGAVPKPKRVVLATHWQAACTRRIRYIPCDIAKGNATAPRAAEAAQPIHPALYAREVHVGLREPPMLEAGIVRHASGYWNPGDGHVRIRIEADKLDQPQD